MSDAEQAFAAASATLSRRIRDPQSARTRGDEVNYGIAYQNLLRTGKRQFQLPQKMRPR